MRAAILLLLAGPFGNRCEAQIPAIQGSRTTQTTQVSGVPLAVYDLFDHFTRKKVPEAPQIWLGSSLLSAFTVTLDPDHMIVTFGQSTTVLPKDSIKVPFEIRDGRIFVQMKINDKK